ncbi:MAG TPA: hypothetical protein VM305_08285 [Candidatus Limnocylindrales bacterium]|nr:hypothetical protein [Candidatus Limnocylindrales bacterium]
MSDRKQERIDAKLGRRQFDDEDVRATLDDMDVDSLVAVLGEPSVRRVYAEPYGYWKQGDGRPALADEDPAVMQAIGRCATARATHKSRVPGIPVDFVHPAECGWCVYPLEQLLAACDCNVWHSRLLLVEMLVWRKGEERGERFVTYERVNRQNVYENRAHAAYWAASEQERANRIADARAKAAA